MFTLNTLNDQVINTMGRNKIFLVNYIAKDVVRCSFSTILRTSLILLQPSLYKQGFV